MSSDRGPAIRILLVEDRPLARKLLEAEFATVTDMEIVAEARNGREAIEKVRADPPDVVIMDIVMPEMDGIKALVAIREFSDVPVIMFSGSKENAESLRHIALRRGADAFILKPSGSVSADLYKVRDELIETIRALVAPRPPSRR